MKNLYYDIKKKCWSCATRKEITESESKPFLPFLPHTTNTLYSFPMLEKNHQLGPIIGIMVAFNKNNQLIGNTTLFQRLQQELNLTGGLIIVFAPEDLHEEEVSGYAFLSQKKKWLPMTTPLPHVVYNRVPFRKTEKERSFQQTITFLKKKKIPFFNPVFINKWDLYSLLKDHPILQRYLPETIRLTTKESLMAFLNKFPSIYIKAAEGKKGKNIYRLTKTKTDELLLEHADGSKVYRSVDDIWKKYNNKWSLHPYILQQEIEAAHYDNHRYDYRLLIIYEKDRYVLNGIGVRQSVKQTITTHIPAGGRLISYQKVQSDQDTSFFQTLVENCGDALTNEYGFFGEFSIDACKDIYGKYYLFEINAKPMLFDEKEIEANRCSKLIQLFYQLSGFSPMDE